MVVRTSDPMDATEAFRGSPLNIDWNIVFEGVQAVEDDASSSGSTDPHNTIGSPSVCDGVLEGNKVTPNTRDDLDPEEASEYIAADAQNGKVAPSMRDDDLPSDEVIAIAKPPPKDVAPKGGIAPVRRKKKPKGMPKRPLSSYNWFFRHERKRTSEEKEKNGGESKLSFEDMGKLVGKRWKSLSDEERKCYEEMAEQDTIRYRCAIA